MDIAYTAYDDVGIDCMGYNICIAVANILEDTLVRRDRPHRRNLSK